MRPTLHVLISLLLFAQGCGSKSKCEKACKMKADCVRAANPGWKCPLSAQCDPTEECLANCILNASCDAMTGTDPQAATALQACEALCTGAKPDTGNPDHGPAHDGPAPDKGPPSPDLKPWPDAPPTKPDQYVWPDLPQQQDQFVWPDTYAGAPFGCVTDAECFGLVCCKTPWGISICAQQCF